MRKTLLLMLAICWSVLLTAGNVTPEEALQQATQFLNGRVNTGNRRAPVTTQQLTMAKQVAGLYVFNVTNDNGFVIVSNDDCAESILGYADEGSFDPDNIPENMKAWLQGYADEIAWAKQHPIQKSTQAANRRAGGAKAPIAPLMNTAWDQTFPYNAYCPSGCATGCVATAMAQVMYYYQWPEGDILKAIPAYDKDFGEKPVSVPLTTDLPVTSFDWANMLQQYSGSETDVQRQAVAKLMYYCGTSLKMNYGTSSSADGAMIAHVLKTYFNYNTTTTQVADRSYYSYANWIELIYNELQQGRVVPYNGQSTGGGHAFVCMGYQGEDYFYINWGWSGASNGYFKLSALDPQVQGTGGSSSTDGYNAGQNAIVGVQKPSDTGTVLSKTNSVNLTLNSVSAEKASMTTDETVNITFSITNNSADEYDGEIGIKFVDGSLGDGKMFLIPAGATKDCVVPFMPKEAGTYKISAYYPTGTGSYAPLDLTKYADVTVTSGTPQTDNLTLTIGVPTVENAELYSGTTYNLYGNQFKAIVRITNTDGAYAYNGTLLWKLIEGSFSGTFSYENKKITIPAGGYIDVPIEVKGLDMNQTYYAIYLDYIKNKTNTGSAQTYIYRINPAIVTYQKDGTTAVTKASGTTYSAPETALAVDLTGTDINTVSGGATNCLFISDKAITGGTNIVKFTGSTYTAENIKLTDGADFYSPVNFTAANIEYTYNNDRWADGTNGWNTIILPFEVTSVTANDTPIDWFKSSSDTGKQFWLKEFVSDAVGTVNFDFTSSMKANTPYIIALPGDHWGAAYNLNGKTIKFVGMNVEVPSSAQAVITCSNYRFVGETKAVSTENIYCINAAGNKFELKATGGSKAFRPFFKNGTYDRTSSSLPAYLTIGTEGISTGIQQIEDVRSKKDNVYYDLNGRRVLYPKKGLYILNGKKVIMK